MTVRQQQLLTYFAVSSHVSFHAATGRELHGTQAADVLLHTSMSTNVSLQYATRHKRLKTLDTQVWFLTYHTSQQSPLYTAINSWSTVISPKTSVPLVFCDMKQKNSA